jgi:hypothetical protein
MRCLCRSVDFITTLSEKVLTYVLIGNHDRINNSIFLTDEHPFTSLKDTKNIVIVDKVIKFKDNLFVPYVPVGRFNEAISEFDLDYCKIIFAHQEFKNSIFENQGDDPPNKNIPIYSGHIHNSVRLDNILFIGTPFQHSFYDNPDKFILELNIDEDYKIEEKKIYLKIIKKRIQEVKISELLDYVIDIDFITKLIISGDRKLLNNDKIQKILKHPNILYKMSLDKKPLIISEKKEEETFRDLLTQRLKKEDKTVGELFKKINQKVNS